MQTSSEEMDAGGIKLDRYIDKSVLLAMLDPEQVRVNGRLATFKVLYAQLYWCSTETIHCG